MLNVFIISNDKRVERLIDYFQPFFKTKIRASADFDQGMKEVFENRPSLVFIQSTIDSVSGDTVARHIKSLLGSTSPKVIFIEKTAGSEKKATSWCDDSIVISDSDDQFREDFGKVISRYFPGEWRSICGATADDPEKVVCDHAEPGKKSPSATHFADEMSDEIAGSDSTAVRQASHSERGVGETVVIDEMPGKMQRAEETIAPDLTFGQVSGKRGRYLAFFAAAALFSIAAMCFFIFRNGTNGMRDTSEPTAKAPDVSPGPVAGTASKQTVVDLPSWVVPGSLDPSYQAEHPGWERYLMPDYDVRIFREGTRIKAMQVIARNDKALSGAFVRSVLDELGYEGSMPAGTERKKEDFLVGNVMLDGFAELVTYRKDKASDLKAFVLEMY